MLIPTLAEWRRQRRVRRELEAMSDRELAELGFFRCDVPSFAHQAARS